MNLCPFCIVTSPECGRQRAGSLHAAADGARVSGPQAQAAGDGRTAAGGTGETVFTFNVNLW